MLLISNDDEYKVEFIFLPDFISSSVFLLVEARRIELRSILNIPCGTTSLVAA